MKRFEIRNQQGHFVAYIWADRIEAAGTDDSCAYLWIGDHIVAGLAGRNSGVHVFLDGKEVVGTPAFQPSIEDFYPQEVAAQ